MKDLIDISNNTNEMPANAKAILQAIDNMLSIRIGSFIFNREIGSELEEVLFEPFSFATKHKLDFIIRNSMMSQIPLAKIKSLDIEQNDEKRTYEVNLVIDIQGIGYTEISKTLKSKG